MKHYTFISKTVAGLLVLLILLSITPKLFLHELLADHKDTPSCNDTRLVGPCIHKQGYNCQQSELVVPHAFIGNEFQEPEHHRDFRVCNTPFYFSYLTENFISYSQERAPPQFV